MILRVFRARTHPGMDKDFEQWLLETALPLMEKQDGCEEVLLGRTRWGGQPEFVVMSKWTTLEDLKRFAGAEWQNARIMPEEAHMVKHVNCDHFEVLRT